MTKQQVIEAALVLDETDRQEIADALRASVAHKADDLSPEWLAEIERRAQAADRGEVKMFTADEVMERIDARLAEVRRRRA